MARPKTEEAKLTVEEVELIDRYRTAKDNFVKLCDRNKIKSYLVHDKAMKIATGKITKYIVEGRMVSIAPEVQQAAVTLYQYKEAYSNLMSDIDRRLKSAGKKYTARQYVSYLINSAGGMISLISEINRQNGMY